MAKYATISVPKNVKKLLEGARGTREWGEFLMELYNERTTLRSKRAFEEAVSLLTPEDLTSMLTCSKEFREEFALR